MAILEVINLKKTYTTRFGGSQVRALKNVNFTVENGEYAAVMGEPGSAGPAQLRHRASGREGYHQAER